MSNAHVFKCTTDPTEAPTEVGQHWVNTTNGCHFLSNGTASVANWIKVVGPTLAEVVVAASSTEDLLTTALADMCNQHFQICMFNTSEDKWKSLHLFGSKTTATTVSDSISDILGHNFDLDLNYKVVATDAVLEAINNEAFPITVRFKVETI